MNVRRLVVAWIIVVVSVGLGSGQPAWSSGIPTIDVAAIAQELTSYITQLQEFQQPFCKQVSGSRNWRKCCSTMNRRLREYRSYLNQIRGLQRLISEQDWRRLLRIVVESPFGQGIIAEIPLLSPDDPDYKEKVREKLKEYGYYPDAPETVAEDLADVGISGESAVPLQVYNEDLEKSFSRYQDQLNMASANNEDSKKRTEVINELGESVMELGDESDLATLQMMATQDNFEMHQNEALIRAVTQIGLNYESPSNARMQEKAKMIKAEIERLKRVRARGGAKLSGITSFAGPGF